MSVLGSRASLHEQLGLIMAALTRAAVAEILELVDEGYAALQGEVSRSRKENEALRKKLHLIESIVVRGGGKMLPGEPQPEPGLTGDEAPQPRESDGGAAGGPVEVPEELPDIVLIKDEDSNDAFEEDKKTQMDCVSSRELPTSTNLKGLWTGTEDPDPDLDSAKSSETPKTVTVYNLDEGENMDLDQLDPEVQLVHQESPLVPNRQYFGFPESPSNRDQDLGPPTWSKPSTGPTAFPPYHETAENDAFGIKMVSVTGSADVSEGSSSAFEYEDADLGNFHYRDQQPGPGPGRRRFVCAICAKTYATSQNLEVHMRIHTGERPFACSQCGKKFTQSAHLKSHLSVHSGERPYACSVCSRSFIVKYSLKLHMKKCHGK